MSDFTTTLRECAKVAKPEGCGVTYGLAGLCIQAAAELERLQAENERLRKDAERYKALRWRWHDERDMGPGGRWEAIVSVKKGRPTIDAAIDAAMKEHP